MEKLSPLCRFFAAIQKDGRISITHIGVFAALLESWLEGGGENPLCAYSHEIMKVAKISAQRTYHRCIRDLHDFGYVRYEPSFKRNVRSRVFLLL
jgi:hypothetical protein